MKTYISPDIQSLDVESSTLLAGSLSKDGTEGTLTPSGNPSGASGARVRGFDMSHPYDPTKDNGQMEDEWKSDSI